MFGTVNYLQKGYTLDRRAPRAPACNQRQKCVNENHKHIKDAAQKHAVARLYYVELTQIISKRAAVAATTSDTNGRTTTTRSRAPHGQGG